MKSVRRACFALLIFLPSLPAAKPNLPEKYKTWLEKDAVYIITDDEKKAYLNLGDNESRDKFIETFWEIRNPRRGSDRNPYKEEHYARIEYATEHFGRQSNTPGWMTDQGRAWILFGKPTSHHDFIGYGQIYPLDLWFYENTAGTPSLPPFFTLLFYIPDGIGEYKFYRPYMDGPLKLVRGSNFNSNADVYKALRPLGGDVAKAAFSNEPNSPIDTTSFQPDMTGDMLISRIQNFANDPFNVRRIRELRSLKATVSSYFLVSQDKPLEISSIVLADPTGKHWLDYAVLIDDPKLGKVDADKGQLQLSVAYHLTTESGNLIVEDQEDRAYSEGKEFAPFVVANRIPIEPGVYKLSVDITNRDAGRTYKGDVKVTVGTAKQIAITGPLLAASIEKAEKPDPLAPFQYFGVQFHPAVQRVFGHRNPLRMLFELRETSGISRDYQIEYILANTHDREARRSLSDPVTAAEFKNGVLLKSKTMPLNDLESGDYRLIVNVRVAGATEVATSVNLPVRIEDDQSEPRLYTLSGARGFGRPGVAAYTRSLEATSQRNTTSALEYLRQALDQNPGNVFAGQDLVQLYFNQRQFTPIAELFKRLGVTPFKASPTTLAQISLSLGQAGDRVRARDVLSAAIHDFPDDPVLASAAASLQKLR
jgi:GWxTD domain-containing protein